VHSVQPTVHIARETCAVGMGTRCGGDGRMHAFLRACQLCVTQHTVQSIPKSAQDDGIGTDVGTGRTQRSRSPSAADAARP
jgi:hypothetical protein